MSVARGGKLTENASADTVVETSAAVGGRDAAEPAEPTHEAFRSPEGLA